MTCVVNTNCLGGFKEILQNREKEERNRRGKEEKKEERNRRGKENANEEEKRRRIKNGLQEKKINIKQGVERKVEAWFRETRYLHCIYM